MTQRLLRWIGRGLLGIAVVAVAALLLALGYREYMQWKITSDTRITAPEGIDSLERIELGGIDQWIYLRGQNRAAPVLLYLHGGPGSPEMPLARDFGLRLEEHFVVVHWDQRASGKSAVEEAPSSSLTIGHFVSDTLELIEVLRGRFDEERIYLVGHSWGSGLGTIVARDHSELLHAYVGLGQVVDMRRGEELSYRFVLRKAREQGNQEAIDELSALTPPYEDDVSELFVQRGWLGHFGGAVHRGSILGQISRSMLSPEYALSEIVPIFSAMLELPVAMYSELLAINFIEQAPRLDVPVYFLVGRYDYNTPFELVEEYYESLEAPSKELIWFENSAHSPNLEEPDRFQEILISRVLRATLPSGGELE